MARLSRFGIGSCFGDTFEFGDLDEERWDEFEEFVDYKVLLGSFRRELDGEDRKMWEEAGWVDNKILRPNCYERDEIPE